MSILKTYRSVSTEVTTEDEILKEYANQARVLILDEFFQAKHQRMRCFKLSTTTIFEINTIFLKSLYDISTLINLTLKPIMKFPIVKTSRIVQHTNYCQTIKDIFFQLSY